MHTDIAINSRPISNYGPREKEFYLWSAVFILGNLALPQLCHLAALGGKIWLPIYFCTLIAATRYGWKVGALTAILSPLLNHLLFVMPPAEALPIITAKSLLIAVIAPPMARKFGIGSLLALALTIIGYQFIGGIFETLTVNSAAALADFKLGWPGLLAQLLGCWLVLKLWHKQPQ
jgi:hypothetical protein